MNCGANRLQNSGFSLVSEAVCYSQGGDAQEFELGTELTESPHGGVSMAAAPAAEERMTTPYWPAILAEGSAPMY